MILRRTLAMIDQPGDTAIGAGDITNLGGSNVTQHGHCWAITTNPTITDSKTENGAASATGTFTSDLTNLIPGTWYYTRAYAINSSGTGYGANDHNRRTEELRQRIFD